MALENTNQLFVRPEVVRQLFLFDLCPSVDIWLFLEEITQFREKMDTLIAPTPNTQKLNTTPLHTLLPGDRDVFAQR